jgi:hypothetical protein
MKQVYDYVIRQAVAEGEPGSAIALTVIERGSMDECSVWCSKWQPDAELLYGSGEAQDATHERPACEAVTMHRCRNIVEMHGGHMWIESAPNSWARVIFVLPKRNAELS